MKIAHVPSVFNASAFHILIGSTETSAYSGVLFQDGKKMLSVPSSKESHDSDRMTEMEQNAESPTPTSFHFSIPESVHTETKKNKKIFLLLLSIYTLSSSSL